MEGGKKKGKEEGAHAEASEPFWKEHREEFLALLPFLWPKGEPRLRLFLVLAVICLFGAKVFNVLVPIALKNAVDDVSAGRVPAGSVLCYGIFRFLSDSTREMRDCLFNYVSAYASRMISLRVFNHVQGLSLRFHLNRKTGAVLRAVSRGSSAYSDLLRYISFQILPIFFEVGLVSGYLLTKYSWYFGVITISVIVVYVSFTVTVTEWRNKYRRVQTQMDDAFNTKAVDALLNFETVKYFCAEQHIADVYDESLKAVQDANIASQQSLSLLNAGQNAIISFGVAGAMWLAGREVVNGGMTVGDFVLVNVYILQLYTPLNFLGTYYRMIKQSLVDVESMFKLLRENAEVADAPGAVALRTGTVADVSFDKVTFTYEPKRGPILKSVSLSVGAGQKLAVVGSSGAGKSTIARLLYRLYDVDSGIIYIAGQDIALCTQRSVRLAVGIVPQDCVLFNDTITYNIGFGKLAKGELASEAEVAEAAAAAQLTDFISKQPNGYATTVGERGLRLSGGEKQRVAIARALLKNPPVMVYDEATSALDSRTEKDIQRSMDLAARGRTNLVIAHRLSTIADADVIAVLDGGVVAECGSHSALLATGGLYWTMWQKQAETSSSRTESSADLTALGAGAAVIGGTAGGGATAAAVVSQHGGGQPVPQQHAVAAGAAQAPSLL